VLERRAAHDDLRWNCLTIEKDNASGHPHSIRCRKVVRGNPYDRCWSCAACGL
jgi:hypothetical protein